MAREAGIHPISYVTLRGRVRSLLPISQHTPFKFKEMSVKENQPALGQSLTCLLLSRVSQTQPAFLAFCISVVLQASWLSSCGA